MNTDPHEPPLAVVLFQLGGPDSLDTVEPFLVNLFSDPDIIDFPFARLARPTLARLVARNRAKKVRHCYAEIGGRSPIIELTQRQARALETALRDAGLDARVFVAMRYWHPLTEAAVAEIERGGFGRIILLPLYPQYSHTTTRSSLNEWDRRYAPVQSNRAPVSVISHYYNHPGYLDALVERINQGLARFPQGATVHLVYSAHGVPLSVIEAGDPYCEHMKATVRLAQERGGWTHPHTLCYQSRVGPGRWTKPTLHHTLPALREQGATHALVIPVSFVTDHIETLHEIDRDARRQAEKLGYKQFEVMPALNDSPLFIRALSELVLDVVHPTKEQPCETSSDSASRITPTTSESCTD